MVDIISTTKLPIRLLYNYAKTRFSDHNDKSPLILAILNDPFFQSSIKLGTVDDGSDDDGFDYDETGRQSGSQRVSTSASGTAQDSSLYVVANYWNLPVLTVHAMRTVETGVRVNGGNVLTQVANTSIPAQQTQYIPHQWVSFLGAVTNGQAFKHDEHLYRLLTRIGIPYVDVAVSDTHVKFHYLLDILLFSPDKNGNTSQIFSSLSLSPSYSGHSSAGAPQSLLRLAEFTSGNNGNTSMSTSYSSQSGQTSFNLPSFNTFGAVNQFNTANTPGNDQTPIDPHQAQPIQHRGLPHLFNLLAEHDPVKKNLYKSIQHCDYIKENWFAALLRMMPFLYWAAQAYAKSVQNGMDVAHIVRDGVDEATGEVRGDIALRLLTDHCCKLSDPSKDPSRQIFLLIVVLCKVLTTGTNLESSQRTCFMNQLYEYLGDGNKFSIVDITEFLLGGDWIQFLDCDLSKATKGIMKRFKDSHWVATTPAASGAVISSPTPSRNNSIASVSTGLMSWKENFSSTFLGLEDMYDFMTSKDDDACSIM